MTRSQAEAAPFSLKAEVHRADRTQAKLTTWGAFQSASGPSGQSGPAASSGFTTGEKVWVVAVAGDISPAFSSTANNFPWAVFIYDANTGAPMSMQAGPSGTWPPYFDAMADQGSP
jgi:hypothetical protein